MSVTIHASRTLGLWPFISIVKVVAFPLRTAFHNHKSLTWYDRNTVQKDVKSQVTTFIIFWFFFFMTNHGNNLLSHVRQRTRRFPPNAQVRTNLCIQSLITVFVVISAWPFKLEISDSSLKLKINIGVGTGGGGQGPPIIWKGANISFAPPPHPQ